MNPLRKLLISIAVALFAASASQAEQGVFHDTKLMKVIDGGTLHIQVKVFPNTIVDTKLSLFGITTPNKSSNCPAERVLAQKAKQFTTEMIKNGFSVGFVNNSTYVEHSVGIVGIPLKSLDKKYMTPQASRAYVQSGEEPSLGDALIAAGLAIPYSGKTMRYWPVGLCRMGVTGWVSPSRAIPLEPIRVVTRSTNPSQ